MVENNQKQTEEQWLSMQTGLTSSLAQWQGMERREFTILYTSVSESFLPWCFAHNNQLKVYP